MAQERRGIMLENQPSSLPSRAVSGRKRLRARTMERQSSSRPTPVGREQRFMRLSPTAILRVGVHITPRNLPGLHVRVQRWRKTSGPVVGTPALIRCAQPVVIKAAFRSSGSSETPHAQHNFFVPPKSSRHQSDQLKNGDHRLGVGIC